MANLFGYSLARKKGQDKTGPSFVRKDSDDAAAPILDSMLT